MLPSTHRVEAVAAPRRAPNQSPHRQPSAPQHAIARHSLRRIARATRLETAGRADPRGDTRPVEAQHTEKQPLDSRQVLWRELSSCRLSCLQSFRPDSFAAAALATTTRSDEPRSSRPSKRNHSRIPRFRAFRTTALPTFRLTTIPRRGVSPSPFSTSTSRNSADARRRPFARTYRNSWALLSRFSPPRPWRPLRMMELLGGCRRREPLSPLCSPPLDDVATRRTTHSRAETVHAASTNPTRLVGTLHALKSGPI